MSVRPFEERVRLVQTMCARLPAHGAVHRDLRESEARSVCLGPADKVSIYFSEVDKGGQLFSSELREAFSSLR